MKKKELIMKVRGYFLSFLVLLAVSFGLSCAAARRVRVEDTQKKECTACTFMNLAATKRCTMCDSLMPPPQAKKLEPAVGWTCTFCTFENPGKAKRCTVCDSLMSPPLQAKRLEPVGGWACIECTFENLGTKKRCAICDTPKAVQEVIPKEAAPVALQIDEKLKNEFKEALRDIYIGRPKLLEMWGANGLARMFDQEELIVELNIASNNERCMRIEFLITICGANVNGKVHRDGETPIQIAVSKENSTIFGILLSNGADITIKNYKGQSLLDIAKENLAKAELDIAKEGLTKTERDKKALKIWDNQNIISLLEER
jgi:hypothetical protein